jgi:serine/threonine protein kinase
MIMPVDQFSVSQFQTIGKGGLGIVQRCVVVDSNSWRNPVGTVLARKTLNSNWAQNPDQLARFAQEMAILKKMSHPNIIPFHGENLEGGERCYYMPYYANGSLRGWISNHQTSPVWWNIADEFAKIADALQYAHGFPHLHRDLKPENILLDDEMNPILADWGLGKFIHQHSMVLSAVPVTMGQMGTKYYCSAEQWATGDGGVAGDVYSLGMTMAEAAIKRQVPMLFPGAGITMPVVPGHGPGLIAFNDAIIRMTNPNPAKRFSSMAALAEHLRWVSSMR